MKKLITVFAVLGLWTTIAAADEAPPATTDPATEEAAPEPVDCSTLEGEEKTKCEEEQAAAPEPETGKTGKGGKGLTKSNDNRMESFDEDE